MTLIAMNECGSDTITQMLDLATGITDINDLNTGIIYPNPAGNHILITSLKAELEYQLEIFNISGRKEMEFMNVQKLNVLDISRLNPGIYLVRINDGQNPAFNQILVVTK
ncbi:MAG: T9SS type A sorting domain-containing protein [Chitinophagales bacterium]|nr:T9SS type A sorting domain-containing protein [Chitinophagales bacterium]